MSQTAHHPTPFGLLAASLADAALHTHCAAPRKHPKPRLHPNAAMADAATTATTATAALSPAWALPPHAAPTRLVNATRAALPASAHANAHSHIHSHTPSITHSVIHSITHFITHPNPRATTMPAPAAMAASQAAFAHPAGDAPANSAPAGGVPINPASASGVSISPAPASGALAHADNEHADMAAPACAIGLAGAQASAGNGPQADAKTENRADASAIVLNNVTVRYQGAPAIKHLSARFATGQRWAIVGANGCGKSTLLKAAMRLVRCEAGNVRWQNLRRPDIAYLPQQAGIDRNLPVLVQDLVALGLWHELRWWRGLSRAQWARVHAALDQVGMLALARQPITALSSGQFQRVLFARMLVQGARMLLLDEPFNAVDASTTAELLDVLHGCARNGAGIVAVVHDMEQARTHFDHLLHLEKPVPQAGSRTTVQHCAPAPLHAHQPACQHARHHAAHAHNLHDTPAALATANETATAVEHAMHMADGPAASYAAQHPMPQVTQHAEPAPQLQAASAAAAHAAPPSPTPPPRPCASPTSACQTPPCLLPSSADPDRADHPAAQQALATPAPSTLHGSSAAHAADAATPTAPSPHDDMRNTMHGGTRNSACKRKPPE